MTCIKCLDKARSVYAGNVELDVSFTIQRCIFCAQHVLCFCVYYEIFSIRVLVVKFVKYFTILLKQASSPFFNNLHNSSRFTQCRAYLSKM